MSSGTGLVMFIIMIIALFVVQPTGLLGFIFYMLIVTSVMGLLGRFEKRNHRGEKE